MIPAPLAILAAFIATRRTLNRLRTPQDVRNHQAHLLRRHMRRISSIIPFYRDWRDRPFEEWPILNKVAALENFSALNAHCITREAAWAAAEAGLQTHNGSGRIGRLTVGTSTGTSGNRGLLLISEQERHAWLGAILAKTLPDFPFRRHRVAVMLSTGNELYETTSRSRRIAFAFFDLRRGLEPRRSAVERFDPDVIVAPPKVLRLMAENGWSLNLREAFAGGEVLDPLDAEPVRRRFGVTVRPIYQATEGFLGVACRHGTIHLNEDAMLVEREPVAAAPDRFVPIITDLRRRAQAMVRYRLDDILVAATSACACGSPLTALARIEGRCDDVILAPRAHGNPIPIMPDVIRTAILDADRSIGDFRFVQTGAADFCVALPAGTSDAVGCIVVGGLRKAFSNEGAAQGVEFNLTFGIDTPLDRKLRRVTNLHSGKNPSFSPAAGEGGTRSVTDEGGATASIQ